MTFAITSNPVELYSSLQLRKTDQSLTAALERLAAGGKINRAADDSSGLTIADSLGSDIRGLGQTIRNANDDLAMSRITEGALAEATKIIDTIRTKSLQAAQDGQSAESRAALQADIGRALDSLADLSRNTTYNGKQLISGNLVTQAYAIAEAPGDRETNMASLARIDVTSQDGAQDAQAVADAASAYIDGLRTDLGASQNQLRANLDNLSTTMANLAAASSSVTDADYAEESVAFFQKRLLEQAQIFAQLQTSGVSKKNILELLQG